MGEKAGSIVGLGLALVLVLALAGTPLYLGFLRSPDRALDAAVEADAEVVRRAIANLDHELSLLAYMYTTADPNGFDPAIATQVGRENPELFTGEVLRDLDKAAGALNTVTQRDSQRGTTIKDQSAGQRPSLSAESVAQQITSHLKSPEQILRRADAAMNVLRTASAGGLSASNHLDASRVRALFLLVKARREMDRAAFEYSQAAVFRAAAEKRLRSIEHHRGRLAAQALQNPDALIEKVTTGLDRAKAGEAQLQQAIGQLGAVIQSREEELGRLDELALSAREAMQGLDETKLGFDTYRSRYEELSTMAREAESQAAAIRNGTLQGATLVPQEGPEPTVPQYVDGRIEPGLDTLRFRLEHFHEQMASLRKIQEEAVRELAGLRDLVERQDDTQQMHTQQIHADTTALEGLLKELRAHFDAAHQAEEEALKLIRDATGAARSAVAAAKKRASDAGAAARSGEKVDERLQRVSQDLEMEAFVQTIAGQIAYNAALIRFERIQAAGALAEVASLGERLGIGIETVARADVDALRTEAINELSEALKAFEQAASLIGRINVRLPDNTSAVGRNYVWQAQIGQAACHLLHAALVADDREASFEQQTLAYNLLQEAVEKREQSPLLASAVDTLLYLQQNAR